MSRGVIKLRPLACPHWFLGLLAVAGFVAARCCSQPFKPDRKPDSAQGLPGRTVDRSRWTASPGLRPSAGLRVLPAQTLAFVRRGRCCFCLLSAGPQVDITCPRPPWTRRFPRPLTEAAIVPQLRLGSGSTSARPPRRLTQVVFHSSSVGQQKGPIRRLRGVPAASCGARSSVRL